MHLATLLIFCLALVLEGALRRGRLPFSQSLHKKKQTTFFSWWGEGEISSFDEEKNWTVFFSSSTSASVFAGITRGPRWTGCARTCRTTGKKGQKERKLWYDQRRLPSWCISLEIILPLHTDSPHLLHFCKFRDFCRGICSWGTSGQHQENQSRNMSSLYRDECHLRDSFQLQIPSRKHLVLVPSKRRSHR